ncbi:MAG: lipid II flippase MurJ, partial [Planctomycetota bacterium]|nr:lipid II flippase MurJ [Planctomycetota bacterium]
MSNETAGFERNARTVSALTFLSRFGGLARDATMSRVFGIGPVMDAFAFGFMVPNLFRRLFGEGALSASLLPAFVRELDHDPATALLMARLLISRAMLLLAALVVAVEIPIMLGLFDGDLEIGVRLLAIMLPYAPLICMVALFGSMLHAYGRFGPTAAAPLVLNLLLVISALVTIPLVTAGSLTVEGQITLVAVSVLVAGLIQVTWSLRALRRVATRSGVPDADRARVRCREVLLQALPMAIGLGALQLNTLIDGLIASWPSLIGPTIPGLDVTYPLPPGSMSAISW